MENLLSQKKYSKAACYSRCLLCYNSHGIARSEVREGPMVLSEARDTRCERSEAAYICEADA